MQITVNGKQQQVNTGTSLGQLLKELKLDSKRVVVERNLVAVLRDDYDNIKLNDGDSLEIVQFVGGG